MTIRAHLKAFLRTRIMDAEVETFRQGHIMNVVISYPSSQRAYGIACDVKKKLYRFFGYTHLKYVSPQPDGFTLAEFFCCGFKDKFKNAKA